MKEWRNCPLCGGKIDSDSVTTKGRFYITFPDGCGCVSLMCRKCDLNVYEHDHPSYCGEPPVGYDVLVERLRHRWNTRKACPAVTDKEG